MELIAHSELRLADKPTGGVGGRGVVRKIKMGETFDVEKKYGDELIARKLASLPASSDAEEAKVTSESKAKIAEKVNAGTGGKSE